MPMLLICSKLTKLNFSFLTFVALISGAKLPVVDSRPIKPITPLRRGPEIPKENGLGGAFQVSSYFFPVMMNLDRLSIFY